MRHAVECLEGRALLSGANLVVDINEELIDLSVGDGSSSGPSYLVEINGTLFFAAGNNETGRELWKSDGTTAGTVRVRDIFVGSGGSYPSELTNVGGTLLFTADDGIRGRALWKSDGTTAGTVLVKDFFFGLGLSGANFLVNVEGTLFFRTDNRFDGELWKSDGTESGTVQVKDINPGGSSSNPYPLASIGGTLFFSANDVTHGAELWKTDGTEAGTVLVKDINEGAGSGVFGFTDSAVVGSTLFFQANDGINGPELWKTDGTEAGTVLVKDIREGDGPTYLSYFTNVGGTLFFSAYDGVNGRELWKSDGSEAGTVLVKDIDAENPVFLGSNPQDLFNFGGTLFFSASDGFVGEELWKSDGTEAGTVLVKDIRPQIFGGEGSAPRGFTIHDGALFFSAGDGSNGVELWKTDGTESGTVLVDDIAPDGSAFPSELTSVGGTLLFRATDGSNGTELWKSNGTSNNELVKDINSSNFDSQSPFNLGSVASLGDTLIFSAADGVTFGGTLRRSDGTSGDTRRVRDAVDFPDAPNPFEERDLTTVGNLVYFSASSSIDGIGTGRELWVTDGTELGTVLVMNIAEEVESGGVILVFSSDPRSFTDVGGTAFFSASDGIHGRELWKASGSSGALLVKDINTENGTNAYASSSPDYLANVGGILFFAANDGINGTELWKSDGTEAGTVLVKDIIEGVNGSAPRELTNVNGTLFFVADDGINGEQLWKSDGTTAGTVLVKENRVEGFDYLFLRLSELTAVGDTLFFNADDGINGYELWKSDGTEAGTVLVRDINTGEGFYGDSRPSLLTAVGDTLYFVADDGIHGFELWKSNGTEAGTLLVEDIRVGEDPSLIQSLTNVGGTLYFRANDGITGDEVWKSDGTAGGTIIVADIGEEGGSNPQNFINVNGRLFFTATDNEFGNELRLFEPPEEEPIPSVTLSVAPETLAEAAGTTTVTATLSAASSQDVTVVLGFGGTATNVTDYTRSGSQIVITAGNTSGSITLTAVQDTRDQANETIVVDITEVTNGTESGSQQVTATITDDDAQPTVALDISAAMLAEAGGTSTVTATLSAASSFDVTVELGFGGSATIDSDYIRSNTQIVIAAGNTTGSITLTAVQDTFGEENETIAVEILSVTNGTESGTQAVTGTIVSDDTEVSVEVSPSSVIEDGATNLVYTFTRSGITTGTTTVNLTLGGTATLTTDYAQTGATTFSTKSKTLVFTAGQTIKSITINPVTDTTIEADETVILTVNPSASYSVGASTSATGTITNDDFPSITLAASPASVMENGTANIVYTFTRPGPTTSPLTVNFTVGGTATFDTDYSASGAASFSATTASVTFGVGQASKTVTLDPTGDTTVEPNETILLNLVAGTGYIVGTLTPVTTTITNDDAEVSVAVAPASVTEDGTPNLVYTFTRVGATASALTVNYTVSGSATLTTDYAQTGAATFTASAGTVSIAAGQTTKTIIINPVADTLIESDETVILTLAAAPTYSIGTANAATGTIANDDPRVSLAVTPASLLENGTGNATYTFTRTGPTTNLLTVSFDVGGTATFNSDYATSGAASFSETTGTVTFAAGQASKTVIVDPTSDTQVEANETVVLTLAAGMDYVIGSPLAAMATIANDDAEVTVSVSPSSVEEDGTTNLIYTFSRVGLTTSALTVSFTVGGTATFSSDYSQTGAAAFNATVGSVSFAAGQSTKSVTINPTGNTTAEPDETVIPTVTPAANYSVGTANSAIGTILNDDGSLSLLSLIGELP